MLFRTHNSYKRYFFPAKRAVLHSTTVKEMKRGEGTTVAISPRTSITRAVERKWQTPHVAKCELSDKVFEMMDAPESDVQKDFGWRKGDKQTGNMRQTLLTHQRRFLTHNAAAQVFIIIQPLHFILSLYLYLFSIFFKNVAINVIFMHREIPLYCYFPAYQY